MGAFAGFISYTGEYHIHVRYASGGYMQHYYVTLQRVSLYDIFQVGN